MSNNDDRLNRSDDEQFYGCSIDDQNDQFTNEMEQTNEYHTIFTKRLHENSSLNSTLSNETASDYRNTNDWKSSQAISGDPSNTSCGFENTFKVLEKQLDHLNHTCDDSRSSSRQSRHSRSSTNCTFHSLLSNTSNYDQNNDDVWTSEEMTYRIIERLRQLRNHCTLVNVPSTPDNTNDRNDTTNDEAIGAVGEQNPSTDLRYHISRNQRGEMRLRVLRTLFIDNVLCGNRVSQMTRTFEDIEAVTRLLDEKEKDLELTVQIGKELLAQNSRLENRVAELEGELKSANENLAQLSYDLHTKSSLLAALTSDDDGANSEADTPTVSKSINVDLLHKKITQLETDNKILRDEATQIVKETDAVEEQERKLMEDITNQLNSTNYQYDGLILELEKQKEENKMQHEQIINLTTKLADAEMRLHQLTSENEEQISRLGITEENQNLLAAELAEFKARYQEVFSLFQEAQEQLKQHRKRTIPTVRGGRDITGISYPHVDSLQSELMETSLFSDHSLDSGIASDRGISQQNFNYAKVFDTIKCATKTGQFIDRSGAQLNSMSVLSSASQPRMSPFAGYPNATRSGSSVYSNSINLSSMGMKTMSRESLTTDSEDSYPAKPPTGVPGTPGAKDLEAALKRLTSAEILARRTMLSHAPPGTYSYEDGAIGLPQDIRTPDSIMSTGSSMLSGASSQASRWRLPEKLQIVKPMEGSQTLYRWNRLAQPSMDGLFDERPGIATRGQRPLEELGLRTYCLTDVEEDADENPGKQYQSGNSVYTYTTSTIMHPGDGATKAPSMPQSYMSSHVQSYNSSRQPSPPATPRQGRSRRNSCSTYSFNSSLASVLNERGIKAITPSALNTPAGPNFSPTVTPCNSPEASPTRSYSPEPPLLTGFICSGADLIRRKLLGESERSARSVARNKVLLARQEKRAIRSLRLVEKIESIGLDKIMATNTNSTSISPLALPSSSANNPIRTRNSSPMGQLTSLKHLTNRSSSCNQIDKETIQTVLSKGFSSDSLKALSIISGDSTGDSGGEASSERSTTSSVEPSKSIPPTSLPHTSIPKQTTKTDQSNVATSNEKISPKKARLLQLHKSRQAKCASASRPDLGVVIGDGKKTPILERRSKTANTSAASGVKLPSSPPATAAASQFKESKISPIKSAATPPTESDANATVPTSTTAVPSAVASMFTPIQNLANSLVGFGLFTGRKGGLS